MTGFGNRHRLIMNGWLVAALLLLGLNSYLYFSLESGAIEGNSRTITALQQKLDRLEHAAANAALPALGTIFSSSFFTRSDAGELAQSQTAHTPEGADPTKLPLLTGILQVFDPADGTRYLAVLNGKVCAEKERVADFTVAKITISGVVLNGFGAQWEIKSPAPYYSNDQGK